LLIPMEYLVYLTYTKNKGDFGLLTGTPSVLDRGMSFLGRRASRDLWSAIRVDENPGGLARRIRDSLWGRPTSIDQRYTQASVGDGMSLLDGSPNFNLY